MQLSAAIPLVRIFDEAKAREYYLDFLGFTVEWEHRFEPGMPLYAQISRGDLVLHLTGHHGDATPGSTVFVRVTDVDALQRELIAKNYANLRPGVIDLEWGRMMELTDPFGNRMRWTEPNSEA
jgi:uncharacterized glyoxalase superfamily protein PhnB